jgi:hypothetical protein
MNNATTRTKPTSTTLQARIPHIPKHEYIVHIDCAYIHILMKEIQTIQQERKTKE